MAKTARNGRAPHHPPQEPQVVEPMTIITHPRFRWDVEIDGRGNVVLAITKPNLEQHLMPLGAQQARALGQKLIAPSVELTG